MSVLLVGFAAIMILWALIDLAVLVLVDWDPTRIAVFCAEAIAAIVAMMIRSGLPK